jgi:eukaryotic-like serine/threonine-protein kinase
LTGLSQFLAELRRRNVYRVGAAWGVGAWFVVQAAAIVVPELQLPAWITPALIVVAIGGFPVAVVLAWIFEVTPDGVRRTGPAAAGEASTGQREPRSASRLHRAAFGTLLIALLLGGMGAAWYARHSAVPRGAALYTALEALAAEERYAEAFALAGRAEGRGRPVPDSLRFPFTDRLTLITEPPGARVLALRYEPDADPAAPAAGWEELGSTPLRGLPVTRGEYLLRFELDGRAPAERMASSVQTRSERRGMLAGEVSLTVVLPPPGPLPGDVVFVPGGSYTVASRNLHGQSATLDDFFLDRTEVSSDAFAEFVDAGGYAQTGLWADGAAAHAHRFVDRTGMSAPRGWSSQRPPPGAGRLPVTGVSWFEADAYCRFREARLPTLFEWEKAARDGRLAVGAGVVMPWGYLGARGTADGRANFAGEGPVAVDAHPFGISAYGAHAMAGNAKEWLANAAEDGRALTGGSWTDPVYMFAEVGAMDPAAAAADVGFRCARSAGAGLDDASAQGAHALLLHRPTPVYTPADDATFARLLAHYDYERRPARAEILERTEGAAWVRERVAYDGPDGDRVQALLYLPTGARPPFQTLVLVPGSDVFMGTTLAQAAEWLLEPHIREGRAVFTVIMKGMTGRGMPAGYDWPAPPTAGFRDLMVLHATELRLGLDWLETRDEIDGDAIAYVGMSWGAGSRMVFAALDPRFRAVAFIGGGIDERVQPTLPEAANFNFAPRITVPKLLLNGREDEEHPWLSRAQPLWDLLVEPRELALLEGVGHVPPAELRVPVLRAWLDRHLGPVRR